MSGEIGSDAEETRRGVHRRARQQAESSATSRASPRRPARPWATRRDRVGLRAPAVAKAEAIKGQGRARRAHPDPVAEIAVEILGG